MSLIAGHESTEVLQPREEALDLPAAAVATQLAPVLRLVLPGRPMRRNELDPPGEHPGIQRVAVIAAIANESCRQRAEEARLQCGFDEREFAGVCTCDSNGERKTSTVCDCHDLGAFPFSGEADGEAPFFAPAKVASMNASVKSYPPAAASSRARSANTRYNVPFRAQSWNRR